MTTSTTTQPTITARGDAWTRRLVVTGALVVALVNGILSFRALASLAADEGFSKSDAWLFPIAVDVMMLVMASVAFHGAMRGKRLVPAYLATALGAGISLYGNVMYAYDGSVLRILLHSVPPIFLLMSIEAAFYMVRIRLSESAIQEQEEARERARVERAEQKRQRAAQKAQERSSTPRTAITAPSTREEVFTPAPSVSSKPVSKPVVKADSDRVTEVKKVMESEEFTNLMASSPTNADAARWLMDRVPGVTASEAAGAGFLAEDGDDPVKRQGYMRVRSAFKSAERNQADSSQEAAEAPVERRLVAA